MSLRRGDIESQKARELAEGYREEISTDVPNIIILRRRKLLNDDGNGSEMNISTQLDDFVCECTDCFDD
ncbi:hypothetical protein BAC3_00388 [uncultured bacterium]|nr:hypothetical protein BAC3_00388 [uncultured bacterium]